MMRLIKPIGLDLTLWRYSGYSLQGEWRIKIYTTIMIACCDLNISRVRVDGKEQGGQVAGGHAGVNVKRGVPTPLEVGFVSRDFFGIFK